MNIWISLFTIVFSIVAVTVIGAILTKISNKNLIEFTNKLIKENRKNRHE